MNTLSYLKTDWVRNRNSGIIFAVCGCAIELKRGVGLILRRGEREPDTIFYREPFRPLAIRDA